ncbi:MAG: CusA/CzcA family heavy metal efflux RND transporter [Candidatus Eisenbacteria bacterium]|uniref:CusA/CzcA family heavy metal efflux RND transporter n=1 Tax=Eiseniibacteriota bacterium TaxID=2212470 RepID=A0A849SMZ1_UNCEI|nr:CusA/CzcA family heavy metal efflux RND transporter [Candidatus Eisenbacteria bacterium]
MERIISFSIRQRWLVLLATLGMAALGLYSFGHLPIDAVPDITNVQVQINTPVEALSPLEVEKRITFPIEWAMGGIPGVEQVRSLSRYGLSQLTVIFKDGTDIYFARQLVNQRLQEARESLPSGVEPTMGPISSGLGEIFMWTVEAETSARRPDGRRYTLTDLRTIQDWFVRPQVRTVPGVTEVNSIGGFEKQFHVTPDPAKLLAHGLSFRDVFEALARNNSNAGAGYIEHGDEQYLIRSTGLVQTLADIENVVLRTSDGTPVRVRDVATVEIGQELRTGAATDRGEEAVLGTAIMLIGENSRTVSKRVAEKMEDVNRSLPDGLRTRTLYDRTYLVEATLRTVRNNLFEGALLVVVVLFLLLGNLRAALIVAMAIPFSMLFAITGMVQRNISGNLMSLGAIDFGIIVDGAVVMVENIVRRFAHRQRDLGRLLSHRERLEEAFLSSREVARPTLFGVAIIMIVYLPILTLSGIEGRMFKPMASVVLLALAGALILTFTFVPAAVAVFLRGRVAEDENFLLRFARRAYEPALEWALRRRGLILGAAAVLVVACGFLASRMGSEFVPKLGEGALAIQPARIPSISLRASVAMQKQVETLIRREFPDEVSDIFARTGTAEIATDPMGPNVSDTYVMLTPRSKWKKARTQEELAEAIEEKVKLLAGQNFEISQPIELRFNELIAGVRSDLAVKVFGDDLATMTVAANRISRILSSIRGAADVKVEQTAGLPVLTVDVDREAIARYGLSVADVQELVSTATGGSTVGEVLEGDQRFDLVVRLPEHIRRDLHAIESLPVPIPASEPQPQALALASSSHSEAHRAHVPLGAVARISLLEGPNQVSREDGKRRVVVQANVRGRDLGTFVAEAQRRVQQEVQLPPGYWIRWGGQFENLAAARNRLAVVVPLALFLILVLLFMTFGSIPQTLLVFTGVPLALTGGIIALAIRGLPLSISAGVGFIALSGVAVLNGLVIVSFINALRDRGVPLDQAIREGSVTRLRPVLMTALVASLGFVPMALAHGTGAEVQRPLATVVIGGIISSTLLTLIVIPVLYRLLASRAKAAGTDHEATAPAGESA